MVTSRRVSAAAVRRVARWICCLIVILLVRSFVESDCIAFCSEYGSDG